HGLDIGHVLFGRVVALDWTGGASRWPFDGFGIALQPGGGKVLAGEIVAEALHLLLLAVHEPDVIAEKQMEILVPVARQLLLDRLELEEQVVAERADETETRIFLAAKFVDKRA